MTPKCIIVRTVLAVSGTKQNLRFNKHQREYFLLTEQNKSKQNIRLLKKKNVHTHIF